VIKDKSFMVTEDHLKLLRRAYVGWDGCEYGAPAIDCKRPYGNSDVVGDIAQILGWPRPDGDDWDWPGPEASERARKLHEETATVLQIILITGRMEAGLYVRSHSWTNDWRPSA
jgi:hypothetical protein